MTFRYHPEYQQYECWKFTRPWPHFPYTRNVTWYIELLQP